MIFVVHTDFLYLKKNEVKPKNRFLEALKHKHKFWRFAKNVGSILLS